jgi:hypothetical protein
MKDGRERRERGKSCRMLEVRKKRSRRVLLPVGNDDGGDARRRQRRLLRGPSYLNVAVGLLWRGVRSLKLRAGGR